jgi:hypothetical protein
MSRRRPFVALAGLASLLFVSSSSFAQIVYEPVQYQYSANGQAYYYGGTDTRMHRHAASPVSAGGTWGRINGWDFVAGDLDTHQEVKFDRPLRVYSDAVGYRNAAFFGYTPDDAMNDANANLPRYFRKADLLNAAHRDETGAVIVPAIAPLVPQATSTGTILIKPYVRPTTRTTKGPVFIFPKEMLDRPLNPPPSPQKVASAGRQPAPAARF